MKAVSYISTLSFLVVSVGLAGETKTATDNLRKASEATHISKSSLKVLSNSAFAASFLTKKGNLRDFANFASDLEKHAATLDRQSTRLLKLADDARTESFEEDESLSELAKLLKLETPTEYLAKLRQEISELPIGIVSDETKDEYKVTVEILIDTPRKAEQRFTAYAKAIKKNSEFLQAMAGQLDNYQKIATNSGKYYSKLSANIAELAPFSGPFFRNTLSQIYIDIDVLAFSYSSLAAELAQKSKESKLAESVERQRYDNLRNTLKIVFKIDIE